MNPLEAGVLLGHISRRDGRQVTKETASAWAADLHDVPVEVAIEVLPGYYREGGRSEKNWIYPGDVLRLVRHHYRAQMRQVVAEAESRVLGSGGRPDEAWRAAVDALRQYRAGIPIELPKQLEAGE